jgi:protein O-GlcNAc transferase
LCGRADLLAGMKLYPQALAGYERALAVRPDDIDALYNCANVLSQLKRYGEAVAAYEAALAIRPDHARALENRGNALTKLKHYEAALASYDAALALEPDCVGAMTNRGTVLKNLKSYEQALASYDAALALRPDHAEALYGRGNALKEIKRYDEALASYDRALAVTRDHPDAFGWVDAALATCDWKRTAGLIGDLAIEIGDGKPSVTPFTLLGICDDPALHLQCAKNYLEDQMPIRPAPLWTGAKFRNEKIRIAYLSADLQGHATAYLMAELFELHDRSRFEILAISFGRDDRSDMRRRLVQAFDQFHDVRASQDGDVARLISDLRADIAVDLKGYTQDARPEILGFRPAPIQVSFLGFPGTMAADFIDYVIADEVVLPFERQRYFTEKIVHVPDCYQPNDSKRNIADRAPTRAEAGLPEQGFVFCCFNNNYKISPAVFAVWMRILGNVPGSVLWLLRDNAGAQANLRAQAQACGIDPARLVFADRVSLAVHLARHRLADLFLDTLPYNAHTTASDALWAGLPVLTCQGVAFAGRVAASLLRAARLPELVTHSLADYEAAALALAGDESRLAALRERLRSKGTSPLFDSRRFCRHIEAAYATMWDIWQQDGAPRSFGVEATEC